MFNVAEINLCTECEGPFKRVAIWFQGCNINCRGCCNPQLQPLVIKHLMTCEELLDIVLKSHRENGVEGVTFLGGEPTLQLELSVLAARICEEGLGVILFTGRSLTELPEELIRACDMIVDGHFDDTAIDTDRNLIGSTNQVIHCITKRYDDSLKWFTELRPKQVRIDIADGMHISGDVV